MRKAAKIVLATAAVLLLWYGVRRALRPRPPPPTQAQLAQAGRVQILRDSWGVPHIFGKSDADAAFGLAYANAEDDWPTLQLVLAASTGRLGLLQLSAAALANDYYANLIRVREQVEEEWPRTRADFRAVLEGYAAGINLYASLHSSEVDARLLPVTGKDVAAGFEHKLPYLVGLPDVLSKLNGKKALHRGDSIEAEDGGGLGSNAHALAAFRSTDDVTRLNINSHQPWEGPVAWYEAQVVSEEGWNMTGATFPGAPVILHGHNQHLGWAHTVNRFHSIDAYELEMVGERDYRYDGGTRTLEQGDAELDLDIGLLVIPIHKATYRSVQGPVLKTWHGGVESDHAVRWSGMNRGLRAAEQWFRMNKAATFAEWKSAMELQGLPMFNVVYADRESIDYVYDGLIPIRATEGTAILPGDDPRAVWSDYLPYDRMPQVLNPPSGFVQNCNTTPFRATEGAGNPDPAAYPANMGIETQLNNRGLRSLALFGGAARISGAQFERFKFDRTYSRESTMFTEVLAPLLAGLQPRTDEERLGLELLRGWDGVANPESRAAALAILTAGNAKGPQQGFRDALAFLGKGSRRIDAPLGEVQRLRRGSVDLPLGGAPDVLAATHTRTDGAHLIGRQGDSYILLVDFAKDGVRSRSIQPYGASNRPGSAHYADQAPLFVRQELKPAWRTREEIRAHLEREYAPGQEPR